MGSRTSSISQKNTTVINFAQSRTQSQVSIDFSCTVLEIQNTSFPNVLGHGKSYEHGFEKKYDGYKLYTKSGFNQFFIDRLENSKFKPFLTYLPIGSHTSLVSQKNVMVINIVQSHVQIRVSIGFSCTVMEIQNTGHSQRIRPWEVARARFREKIQ
ncbi:hypothetical protein GW17_00060984 [Ensete ventricosum]|nr:hypothetical protein GW17_00060984 [Ensete ventricosum]